MAYKKWVVADVNKEQASSISEKFGLDPFVSYLLAARGIDSEKEVSEFLSPSYTFASPMGFKDMDKAVLRISQALDFGERICVYGDYDCDGVTSTALLVSFFESMGADVFCYIPDRESEGYGINKDAVKQIADKGAKLVITVDTGISAIEESEYIYELGMELIVTDHHQLSSSLPRAQAVINPHRTDNNIPFSSFCGVGVAFKLVCALCDDTDEALSQFADLVAIGTIADVVPLKGENRSLVRAGLELINEQSRIGINALKNAAGGNGAQYTASDVAFRICPRINAAGRLSSAMNALELLLCDDVDKADAIAKALCDENSRRQELEKNIFADIKSQVENKPYLVSGRVTVIAGANYHPGVVGIVASHVLEEYGKPAIVISINDDGTATGSARSVEGFNIYEAIDACSSLLIRYGGHPMAAGIGIDKNNIDAFRDTINDFAYSHYDVMPHESLNIDCKLSPHYLSLELVDALSVLEPCGADNKVAVFGLYSLTLISVSPMGEGRHIRLDVEKNGKKIRIVKFGTSPDDFPYSVGDKIDCAVTISRNDFKGKSYLSTQAVDIRKNGVNDDAYFQSKDDFDLISAGKTAKLPFYPSRNDCSLIYRFLRSKVEWGGSETDLYFALSQKLTLSQIHYALIAFKQAGLIEYDKKITLIEPTEKKDLESTDILISLKEGLH